MQGHSASFGFKYGSSEMYNLLLPSGSKVLFWRGAGVTWLLGKDTWSSSCPLHWLTPQRRAWSSLFSPFTILLELLVQVPASCIFLAESKPRLLRTCRLVPSHFCGHCGRHGNSLAVPGHHQGEVRIAWDSMKLCSFYSPGPCWRQGNVVFGLQSRKREAQCLQLREFFQHFNSFNASLTPHPTCTSAQGNSLRSPFPEALSF